MMRVIDGEAAPRREVQAVRWVDVRSALMLLTYSHDRELLAMTASPAMAAASDT